jgi:phosphoribosyl 1,2-cyclic phosphate phosphodiesterase
MKGLITVLGSGTSMGVPTIGCQCRVCLSQDPHDKRTRPSLLLQYGGRSVVIDTAPDFRFQAIRSGLRRLDAILFTHPHADHILGLDDIRPFSFHQGEIPIYGNRKTIEAIRHTFRYIFDGNYPFGGVPRIAAHVIEGPLELFGARFTPVPVVHGFMEVLGFRFGPAAYLTDYGAIPEASFALLEGLEVVFLDALRHEPHPTHCTVEQALAHAARIRARRALLTHIAHDLGHEETNARLPDNVRLCYDGLQVEVEL